MTIERIIDLLKIEHECMLRGAHNDCDRNCADCDLVQDDAELHEMYMDAIAMLERQKAVEPMIKTAVIPGKTWWYICGACNGSIDENDAFCRHCGRRMRWND